MTGRNTGGLHIEVVGSHNGYGDYLRRCAEAGKPVSMVKSFFDGGALMEAKSVSASTITIWRGRPADTDDSDNPHPELDWLWPPSMNAQYADEWMSALYARWLPDKNVTDYLEIVNEPNGGGDPLQFQNQRDFFIECMKWADSHNPHFKVAIGSFSSGCPTEWQTEILAPSFDYAARHGHIVALHDGSVDEDRPLFSQAEEDGTAYRYRMYNSILDRLGMMRPRYAITEGYRPGGYDGMNSAEWADMQAYLQNLARDGVLGWAWFSLGDYDFGGGSVNVVGQLPRYTNLLVSTDWPDETTPPNPVDDSPIILKIPFLSQTSITADLSYNDCGPACEAILARMLGDEHTVNDWYIASGAGLGYISIAEMVMAAANMGYTLNVFRNQSLDSLRAAISGGKPAILLMNPVGLRACGTTAPHFIVAVGFSKSSNSFYCHDPYFIAPGVGGPMIEQPTLAEAWSRCHEQSNPDWLMMTLGEWVEPEPIGGAWRGLQLRNGDNTTADWQCVVEARLDAVKLTTDTAMDDLFFACTLVQPDRILLRLFADLSDRVVMPQEFASWFNDWLDVFWSAGGQYVEIHNEPNLYAEGLGYSWQDGVSFGAWLSAVLLELRRRQPSLKYGFPGLSPGESVAGIRIDEATFYAEARSAAMKCDWLGVHCYWTNPEGMQADNDGGNYRAYATEGKPLIVTEFSNPGGDSKSQKGWQYKAYYASLPSYIIGAYSFISSADNPAFASETWAGSAIPGIVGS